MVCSLSLFFVVKSAIFVLAKLSSIFSDSISALSGVNEEGFWVCLVFLVGGGGGRKSGALTFREAGGEISEVEARVEMLEEGTVMIKDLLAND